MSTMHLAEGTGVVCGEDDLPPEECTTLNINQVDCLLCLRKYAIELNTCLQDVLSETDRGSNQLSEELTATVNRLLGD